MGVVDQFTGSGALHPSWLRIVLKWPLAIQRKNFSAPKMWYTFQIWGWVILSPFIYRKMHPSSQHPLKCWPLSWLSHLQSFPLMTLIPGLTFFLVTIQVFAAALPIGIGPGPGVGASSICLQGRRDVRVVQNCKLHVQVWNAFSKNIFWKPFWLSFEQIFALQFEILNA